MFDRQQLEEQSSLRTAPRESLPDVDIAVYDIRGVRVRVSGAELCASTCSAGANILGSDAPDRRRREYCIWRMAWDGRVARLAHTPARPLAVVLAF